MMIANNTMLGAVDPAWFVPQFNQGDFHLSNAHPAAIDTAASWNTGDPMVDIDGQPRPSTDGTADVAGADIP